MMSVMSHLSKPFAWVGEELYVVVDELEDPDVAWIPVHLIEDIRMTAPKTEAEATVFIVEKGKDGEPNKIHRAVETITFKGGEIMCVLGGEVNETGTGH